MDVLRKIASDRQLTLYQLMYKVFIIWMLSDCALVGDKGYLPKAVQLSLFEVTNIRSAIKKSSKKR